MPPGSTATTEEFQRAKAACIAQAYSTRADAFGINAVMAACMRANGWALIWQ
jgi:hypothetical protein